MLRKFYSLMALAAIAGGVTVLAGNAGATVFTWNGTNSSDPTVASNWSNPAPVIGGANNGTGNSYSAADNVTVSGTAHPLDYTAVDGTTSFDGQFEISLGAVLNISGGTFTDADVTNSGALIGQVSSGTLNVSGGNFNISDNQVILGNVNNPDVGTINLSGGTITANTTAGAAGVVLGNAGNGGPGTGVLTITGGVFKITAGGTTIGNNAGGQTGSGTLTFGLGSGVFEQTASSSLTIGTKGVINFLSGSRGELSLNQVTSRSYFDNLVTAGQITLNGATATPSDFAFTTTGSGTAEQGIYTLVPELATLGLMGIGMAGLLLLKRRRTA